MIKYIKLAISFLCILTFNASSLAEPLTDKARSITLATTKWCPYTCFDSENEFGIVGLYIKEILSAHNIKLSIHSYPWSRAVRLAENNKVDGLLTAIHSEAPGLIFTNTPVGSYQMCFYTLKSNQWVFNETLNFGTNFSDNVIAVIQDYGYGEPIDSYIKTNSRVMSLTGSDVTERLIGLLLAGRADIIVADKLVLGYKNTNKLIDLSLIKSAGCLSENNFYLALIPTAENKALLKKIDKDLMLKENINFFNSLIFDVYRN